MPSNLAAEGPTKRVMSSLMLSVAESSKHSDNLGAWRRSFRVQSLECVGTPYAWAALTEFDPWFSKHATHLKMHAHDSCASAFFTVTTLTLV
jgi:hypothetical protein